jgi:hypothetical protein
MKFINEIGLIIMGWFGILLTILLYYISIKSILLVFNI